MKKQSETKDAAIAVDARLAAGLTYEGLKDGDEIECEDFWHNGILSWEKGVVQIWEPGKKVFLNNRHKHVGHIILSHRMKNYRPYQK